LLEARSSRLLQQLTVRERPGKYCFRFWQEGPGFDRNLFSPQPIAASMEYIHMNPVKRNLSQKAVDFKWSSARFHLAQTVDRDLPTLTQPDPNWFDRTGVQAEHG
jgi:putative transposase